MKKNTHNKLLLGSAAAATISVLGALAKALYPKKKGKVEQANAFIHKLMDDLKSWQKSKTGTINKNVFIGSIAGSILGITTALLLAPKPGKELMHDILHGFSTEVKKPVKKAVKKEVRVVRRAAAKTIHRKKPHSVSTHSHKSVKKKKRA